MALDTADSAHEGGIPFPAIPNVDTMITQNFTKQPTFFGCNYTDKTPLVMYLPNSPWTSYSNFSFKQASFTDNQLDLTLENSFQLATYGNGTIDDKWPACLACAAIRGSMRRIGMNMPEQCDQCFKQHCWDGKESDQKVTEAEQDPRPRLDEELGYEEWYTGSWLKGSSAQGKSGEEADSDDRASSLLSLPAPVALYMGVALASFIIIFG